MLKFSGYKGAREGTNWEILTELLKIFLNQNSRGRVPVLVKNSPLPPQSPSPSKRTLAKILYTKSGVLNVSCRVNWAWSEGVNWLIGQIVLLCVHCVVLCTLCCSVYIVLFCVHCVVLCTLCCSVYIVLYCVYCVVLCISCCS